LSKVGGFRWVVNRLPLDQFFGLGPSQPERPALVICTLPEHTPQIRLVPDNLWQGFGDRLSSLVH